MLGDPLAGGEGDRLGLTGSVADAADLGAVAPRTAGPGFADERRYPLQTRLGWGPTTRAASELQKPGESYTPPASVLSGFAAGGVSLTVSYSPFRGFDPAPIAAALSRYPYGCSEQLVSTAFPLLYAPEVGGAPKLRAAAIGAGSKPRNGE